MKTYKYEYMIDDLCKHDFDISHMSTSLCQNIYTSSTSGNIFQLLQFHPENLSTLWYISYIVYMKK